MHMVKSFIVIYRIHERILILLLESLKIQNSTKVLNFEETLMFNCVLSLTYVVSWVRCGS